MGPGHLCPGNDQITRMTDTDIKKLQWGRGISAPEMPDTDPHAVVDDMLQWGRGISAPEMCSIGVFRVAAVIASMGPGHLCPGNVHTELILIHPFRDGNGRVARLLSTLMALQANFPLLNFEPMAGDNRENYYSAIKEGFNRNYEPMERVFRLVINLTLSDHGKKV